MNQEYILIVDDQEMNRIILRDLFKNELRILEAANGMEAVERLKENRDQIIAVLLDVIMPEMDGFGVLRYMKTTELMKQIPVILITSETAPSTEKKAYQMGVSDFINKPFDPLIVRKRVFNIIELYQHKNNVEYLAKLQTEKLDIKTKKLREINGLIIDTFGTIVEFRNLESGQHIKRMKGFVKILLKTLSEQFVEYYHSSEEIDSISVASALHDVGKIAIPDAILLKPDKLTPSEYEIMKTHSIKGCELINAISFIEDKKFFKHCYEICRFHHERYDGKGYPDGIEGDSIPIAAQVVALADVYDALLSKRIYKKAYGKEEAYEMILKGECGNFSPVMVEVFKQSREQMEQLADSLQ